MNAIVALPNVAPAVYVVPFTGAVSGAVPDGVRNTKYPDAPAAAV